jgi:hypothetical protein
VGLSKSLGGRSNQALFLVINMNRWNVDSGEVDIGMAENGRKAYSQVVNTQNGAHHLQIITQWGSVRKGFISFFPGFS